MTVKDIERIKEEMITDIKLKISLLKGKYDFYSKHDEMQLATQYATAGFNLYRKIDKLRAINIDLLDLNTLLRIEEYIVLLRKEDNFDYEEIEAFLKICR